MREQLHNARNYMRRTARDIGCAFDIAIDNSVNTPNFVRNEVIGAGLVVTGLGVALTTYFLPPFSPKALIGGLATETVGAITMATEFAKCVAAGWRQDAPARQDRQRSDRLADNLQTLHRAHGLTAEKQQARSQLLSAISDAAAMKQQTSVGNADLIQLNNARKQQFIDTLIRDAKDGTKEIDGMLYEHKEPNGRAQRGILFTHDPFGTGKPATLFSLSAKTYSYAKQVAAEHGVAFATPPKDLLQKMSEATSATLAIVTSPPRPYALSAKIEADNALTKKQIPIIDRSMDRAANSGGFILFQNPKDPGVQRGMIHLGDGPESQKPYMITRLSAATLRHAAQRGKTINSELTVQSGNLRDILADYIDDHNNNDSPAPARRNWRAAIAVSTRTNAIPR